MAASPATERIARREWLLLGVLLLSLCAAVSGLKNLARIDLGLYDRAMQLMPQPARSDIILIGIDDYSLAELGKWPWPRQRHADLLKQLHATEAKAIGFDILFNESEASTADLPLGGDQALAQALIASNKVVLPLVSSSIGNGLQVSRPIALLADAARELGHIHLELDADGVARSVFLREGSQGQWWPHFALALKDVGRQAAVGTERYLPGQRRPAAAPDATPSSGVWQRDYQMHIAFSGGHGHFQAVPYVSVLRGEVPASFFKDKYILIGATAAGMADSFPTPVSGTTGVVSGIEINANILASLLNERAIRFADTSDTVLYNLLPILLALLALRWMSPRQALLSIVLLFAATLLVAYLALRFAGLWLAPSAALLVLLLAYPLWSWRRLEAAINYLGEEFDLLEQEPHLLPEFNDEVAVVHSTDALEQKINLMRVAAGRVRDLRQFVSDSLASLPDATLVTTVDGNVLLSNQAARSYFLSLGFPQVDDSLLPYLFASMTPPQDGSADPTHSFSWWDILDLQHTQNMQQGIEVRDPQQHDMLIKSAPCYNAQHRLIGWIVSLLDLTAIRAAERSRDETLHFISHDMRAPQASILALLELQKDAATALPAEEFMLRIEKASRITLALADNFVQLARAESQDYRFEEMDFQDVLLDASEEMWSLARSKNIRIDTKVDGADFPVRIDRSLMTRTLTNLLSNAIKYSPRDTTITCTLLIKQELAHREILCCISDQGYGIPRAEQSRLFQRFQRISHGEQPKNDGVGLGMVFVKAVLDRHHAQISVTSAPNEGSSFLITLPASDL